jgi:hypothetical protein
LCKVKKWGSGVISPVFAGHDCVSMFCATAATRVAVEERKQGAAFSSPVSLLKILVNI